jgi:hypothetical protein
MLLSFIPILEWQLMLRRQLNVPASSLCRGGSVMSRRQLHVSSSAFCSSVSASFNVRCAFLPSAFCSGVKFAVLTAHWQMAGLGSERANH